MEIKYFSLLILVSFVITTILIKIYMKIAKKRNIIAYDAHKLNKKKIIDIAGIPLFLGYFFTISLIYPFISKNLAVNILIGLLSLTLVAFIGLIDDLLELKPIEKIILTFFASIPLVITRTGNSTIYFPFLGVIDFKIIYYLLIMPIYFSVFANMTNMLAGYNGLESGLGLINLITLVILAIKLNLKHTILFITPYIGSLFAIYLYNKYPAKVFLGDTGTLQIGALIAISLIIDNAELLGIYLGIIYLLHFTIYFVYTFFFFQKYGDPKISSVDSKGFLKPVYFNNKKKAMHKLYFIIEHLFNPITEKQLVYGFYITQIIINVIILIIYF